MPQIFDVTANENTLYKRNELECIITTSLSGRVPYFTIILHYNNIPDWAVPYFTIILHYNNNPDWTGALFFHYTTIYQHP